MPPRRGGAANGQTPKSGDTRTSGRRTGKTAADPPPTSNDNNDKMASPKRQINTNAAPSDNGSNESGLPPILDFLTPSNFRGNFPLDTNRISNFPPEEVAKNAQNTRVILHPRMPELLERFLKHKREHGSAVEKVFYGGSAPPAASNAGTTTAAATTTSIFSTKQATHNSKTTAAAATPPMDWRALATRLIAQRPLCFLGGADVTRLRSNQSIGGAWKEWDRVGTDAQHLNQHLTLAEYLSYDEMALGALLGVSGPTHFLNSGSRANAGEVPAEGDANAVDHEPSGVMVGLVGTRFERAAQMDSPLILRDAAEKAAAAAASRRGQVVGGAQSAEVTRMLQEWLLPGRTGPPRTYAGGGRFDVDMYKARMRATFDVLLLEADARAAAAGKGAWVHVVGLGLGVWRVVHEQNTWFVEAFAESLAALLAGEGGVDAPLTHIDTVEFGWIDVGEQTRKMVERAGAAAMVDVRFTQADPARKLPKEGVLPVISWAWDANSYVGNEYWNGYLTSSGDPAAVCFTTIGELMNPDINPFAGRLAVLGKESGGEEGE